jgi:hypothetical protein
MAQARFVVDWSEDELFSKSDLVVIATPVSNVDVKQHERFHGPQFRDVPVIGVFTTFAVKQVLKGPESITSIIFHHFREKDVPVPKDVGGDVFYSGHSINAPTFAFFDPGRKKTFRLFLIREHSGHYAPSAGQEDINLSVMLIPDPRKY